MTDADNCKLVSSSSSSCLQQHLFACRQGKGGEGREKVWVNILSLSSTIMVGHTHGTMIANLHGTLVSQSSNAFSLSLSLSPSSSTLFLFLLFLSSGKTIIACWSYLQSKMCVTFANSILSLVLLHYLFCLLSSSDLWLLMEPPLFFIVNNTFENEVNIVLQPISLSTTFSLFLLLLANHNNLLKGQRCSAGWRFYG